MNLQKLKFRRVYIVSGIPRSLMKMHCDSATHFYYANRNKIELLYKTFVTTE